MTELQRLFIQLSAMHLDRASKFYSADRAKIRAAAFNKTEAELLESISRMQAISATTERECRLHCQL